MKREALAEPGKNAVSGIENFTISRAGKFQEKGKFLSVGFGQTSKNGIPPLRKESGRSDAEDAKEGRRYQSFSPLFSFFAFLVLTRG